MKEWILVMHGSSKYWRTSDGIAVGNTAREAIDAWKTKRPDEVRDYKYVGIIDLETAKKNGYATGRPAFDEWIRNFFLNWVKMPGNFVPVDGPMVELEERAGGRLHLSVSTM